MKKYLFLLFLTSLCGCAVETELSMTDLPQPLYINNNDGTTYMAPSSENPPENALDYSQIDKLVKNYGLPAYGSIITKERFIPFSQDSWRPSKEVLEYSSNNFIFRPADSSNTAYANITYPGNRFVPNQSGFAEQTTNYVSGYGQYSDGFINTKLVLGGGMTGLNYVDFGYWVGIPKNTTKDVLYLAFASKVPHTYNIIANRSYTGKTAAVAFDNSISGSARELGGDAVLTLDDSKNAHLNLAFNDYYNFNIYATYKNSDLCSWQDVSSVLVDGTNTNGGPAFSSCVSNCGSNYVDIKTAGQYQGDEAAGTYRYTDGNSVLIGSFGAKLDN